MLSIIERQEQWQQSIPLVRECSLLDCWLKHMLTYKSSHSVRIQWIKESFAMMVSLLIFLLCLMVIEFCSLWNYFIRSMEHVEASKLFWWNIVLVGNICHIVECYRWNWIHWHTFTNLYHFDNSIFIWYSIKREMFGWEISTVSINKLNQFKSKLF